MLILSSVLMRRFSFHTNVRRLNLRGMMRYSETEDSVERMAVLEDGRKSSIAFAETLPDASSVVAGKTSSKVEVGWGQELRSVPLRKNRNHSKQVCCCSPPKASVEADRLLKFHWIPSNRTDRRLSRLEQLCSLTLATTNRHWAQRGRRVVLLENVRSLHRWASEDSLPARKE